MNLQLFSALIFICLSFQFVIGVKNFKKYLSPGEFFKRSFAMEQSGNTTAENLITPEIKITSENKTNDANITNTETSIKNQTKHHHHNHSETAKHRNRHHKTKKEHHGFFNNIFIESMNPFEKTEVVHIDDPNNKFADNLTNTKQQLQFYDEMAEILTQILLEPNIIPPENFTQIRDNKTLTANSSVSNNHTNNNSLTNNTSHQKDSQVDFKDYQHIIKQLVEAQDEAQQEHIEVHRHEDYLTKSQRKLDELAANVRILSTALFATQQIMESTSLNVQSAQLQLTTHEQLLYMACQKVDSLLDKICEILESNMKNEILEEIFGKITAQEKEFLIKIGFLRSNDSPSLKRKKREANFNNDEMTTAKLVSHKLSDNLTSDEINNLVKVLSKLNGN